MRILIHGINFSPELTGIGKYSGEMAEWLAAQGHDVRAVTAPPYYPQWKVADGFVNGWRKEQNQNLPPPAAEGINANGSLVVYRCPLWVPAKPSGLKRVLHLASFALSSFPILLRHIFWRPDVVWVVEPPLFCAPQALLVARLSGAKAWLHIQDYEVDAAFDLGLLKGAVLRGLVATCERWLMRRFDRVSTISQRMVDRAAAKGVEQDHIVLFRNWVVLRSAFETQDSVLNGYRAELGISVNAVVALYSGNMGGKQGLEILAQVAKLCGDRSWRSGFTSRAQEPPQSNPTEKRRDQSRSAENLHSQPAEVIFVFCGNGAGRAELVANCEGLQNVRFLELQPVDRLAELLATADIHLLPQRADAADLVMPSKLTGMLASSRPVVATAQTGTELAGVVADCGLVVPPEDAYAFAEAILLLANDADLRARLGASGRAYAEAYLDQAAVLGGFEAELFTLTRL